MIIVYLDVHVDSRVCGAGGSEACIACHSTSSAALRYLAHYMCVIAGQDAKGTHRAACPTCRAASFSFSS